MNWLVWALFGNDLDGVDADSDQAKEWRPELTGWKRRVLWWFRNPFHNLLWHVLGVVDRQTQKRAFDYDRWGRFIGSNLPPEPYRWNLCVIEPHVGGWPILPFVALRLGKWEMYAGWRERGNLGFSVRRA